MVDWARVKHQVTYLHCITISYHLHNSLHVSCITASQSSTVCTPIYLSAALQSSIMFICMTVYMSAASQSSIVCTTVYMSAASQSSIVCTTVYMSAASQSSIVCTTVYMSAASLHNNHLLSAQQFTCLLHHYITIPITCTTVYMSVASCHNPLPSAQQFTCLLHHNPLSSAQQSTWLLYHCFTILYHLHNSLHGCCTTASQSSITCTTVYMVVVPLLHNPLSPAQQFTWLLYHCFTILYHLHNSLHGCYITASQSSITCTTVYMVVVSLLHNPLSSAQQFTCLLNHCTTICHTIYTSEVSYDNDTKQYPVRCLR